jgi:hypothetical protein
MSSEHFRGLCRAGLSADDARLLPFCTLDPFKISGDADPKAVPVAASQTFIRQWSEWEKALRFNLARARAARIKRDNPPEAPDYPQDAVAAAKTASTMDSPLEAEIFLDGARWKAIENFQGLGYFEINTVYAYLLKLLLMERRSAFRTEEGFTEYKGLYASIVEAASTSTESGAPK